MTREIVSGHLLDESVELSLVELCNACSKDVKWVKALVQEGVLDPIDTGERHWRFSAVSLQRVHCAMRLERDLGINLAGIALAIDLLEDLAALRSRLERMESQFET
jgi:chaperone modulatory protein CbpM